jgi:putative transposase
VGDRPSGKPARPWLTVIEDDYSRVVVGYAVNVGAPSATRTALALRQAIWRKSEPGWHVCGIQGTFYTGHGCDFTSQHLEQVAADLKIRLMFSGKGRADRRAAGRAGRRAGDAVPGSAYPTSLGPAKRRRAGLRWQDRSRLDDRNPRG